MGGEHQHQDPPCPLLCSSSPMHVPSQRVRPFLQAERRVQGAGHRRRLHVHGGLPGKVRRSVNPVEPGFSLNNGLAHTPHRLHLAGPGKKCMAGRYDR